MSKVKLDPFVLTMPDNGYWRVGEQVGKTGSRTGTKPGSRRQPRCWTGSGLTTTGRRTSAHTGHWSRSEICRVSGGRWRAGYERPCLMCAERTPEQCHRRLLGEALVGGDPTRLRHL